MAGTNAAGNKKVNRNINSKVNRSKPKVQISRRRSVSKAKTGRYIDLPAVKKLRAAAFSLEEIAEMVEMVTRHAVHKWRCGRARPKLYQREALLKSLQIPVHEWLLEEERKKMEAYLDAINEDRRYSRKVQKKYLRSLGRVG